jgi:molecular chaperone GrpE
VGSKIDSASSESVDSKKINFQDDFENTPEYLTEHTDNEIQILESKLIDESEKNLRLQAELDNFRKRSSQEVLNAGKFAIEDFALNLLPVADSLEAAINLKDQSEDQLKSGVELTFKQLQQTFERSDLKIINPQIGEKFDPNHHQAVSTLKGDVNDPPVSAGNILNVLQKGYFLAGRVLRPALVVVAD